LRLQILVCDESGGSIAVASFEEIEMKLKKVFGFVLSCLVLGSAVPALAGTISYTCDPSVAASTCNYLNTVVAGQYSSTFTNASANIYIQYGTTGLASTSSYLNDTSYSSYLSALTANANQSSLQMQALTALNTYDTAPYGSGNVEITDALAEALGLTSGLMGITAGGGGCSFPTIGCYNAVVTITNDPGTPLYYDNLGGSQASDAYDFYSIVEHETDEVLGTSSCISTQGASLSNGCSFFGSDIASAADLFRYSAPGSLVLDTSLSTTPGAYFSYDGGATNGATGVGGSPLYYNTLSNGDDYADFVSSSPDCGTNQAIQDAEGCPGEGAGLSILNDGGSEINILNAVGYDLTYSIAPAPTPEPGSLTLLGSGLVGLATYYRRRKRGGEAVS
jgi:PEP-CTERM motif